jgi:WD40 repeat protein
VALSPDGRWLASGHGDGSVSFWDVARQAECRRLGGHRQEVTGLLFSADGRRLLSGSGDTTALYWDVPAAVGE